MNRTSLAQQVKTTTVLPPSQSILQRKRTCGNKTVAGGECVECNSKKQDLHHKSASPSEETEVPPIVNQVLQSPGRPLDISTRTFMEPRFGQNFSKVRVHTDVKAAESARAVNALAYAIGQNIVFSAGQYSPSNLWGQELLAHELAHTVQQGRVSTENTFSDLLTISRPNSTVELEADNAAKSVLSFPSDERTAITLGRSKPMLARFNCSSLDFRSCRTGVHNCGWGGTGTCGWVGPSRGGCICVGARRPPTSKILEVLAIIGLSLALIVTVIAALADPEPATKLLLGGLTAFEAVTLLLLLGYTKNDIRDMGLDPDIA